MTDQPERRYQSTSDVICKVGTGQWPEPQRSRRPEHITAGIFLVLGWAALLWGTSLGLLETIQIDALGIGAVITAIVITLWRSQ
ncbi:MAG: hypothetical protein ACTHPS_08925 [Streptosporangiaceae bacterium]